jgi:hypothetical protein
VIRTWAHEAPSSVASRVISAVRSRRKVGTRSRA